MVCHGSAKEKLFVQQLLDLECTKFGIIRYTMCYGQFLSSKGL